MEKVCPFFSFYGIIIWTGGENFRFCFINTGVNIKVMDNFNSASEKLRYRLQRNTFSVFSDVVEDRKIISQPNQRTCNICSLAQRSFFAGLPESIEKASLYWYINFHTDILQQWFFGLKYNIIVKFCPTSTIARCINLWIWKDIDDTFLPRL